MVALVWNPLERPYYAGVDQGVLYLPGQDGVAWNGLVSISEKADNVFNVDQYIDGTRFALAQNNEVFDFNIQAFTYPDLFNQWIGFDGAYDNQPPKSFGLAYRTGSATTGQIHLVYNATVQRSDINRQSKGADSEAVLFSWDASTRPVVHSNFAPSAHVIIDIASLYPATKTALLPVLFGSVSLAPSLPSLTSLIAIFAANAQLVVVDNGNGTWTATGAASIIQMLDATTFQITHPSVIYTTPTMYSVSTY